MPPLPGGPLQLWPRPWHSGYVYEAHGLFSSSTLIRNRSFAVLNGLSDDSVDVWQIWQLRVGEGVLALREVKSHVFCHILENKGLRCGYQILIFEVARSLGDTLATLDRNRN